MTKKSAAFELEKYNEETRKRNAAFAKASLRQKRIAIAREVIEGLRLREFKATTGVYFAAVLQKIVEFKPNLQLQRAFEKFESCEVCSIGSLFLCAVRIGNQLTADEADLRPGPRKYLTMGNNVTLNHLGQWFNSEQLSLIENAFEVWGVNEGEFRAAFEFGSLTKSPTIRLRLIMENIVANKGVFHPRKKPTRVRHEWVTPGYRAA